MPETTPVVYVFHGEDEYAIAQVIAGMEVEMGDPGTASLNTSHLDGRNLSLDDLQTTAASIPFMGDRRLVIVTNMLGSLNIPASQEKFLKVLESLPSSTRLVFVENKSLPEKHWLVSWAVQTPQIAFTKHFAPRTGHALATWIQEQAHQAGGSFTPAAAELLAGLVGEDPRMANQEIHKLLAYVNYQRPVEADDVRDITPDASNLENYALANALRERNPRKALQVLCKELDRTEPYLLMGSITHQFRTLLCARDVLDRGGDMRSLVNEMKITEGHARHLYQQAQKVTSAELEDIYRRLLAIDEAIKTSQMDGDVALECFVTDFTTH
jgi:DNA polymerase-3 subunit delta